MKQFAVHVLGSSPEAPFPDPRLCEHPDGLVAVGGDLSRARLLNAYQCGIFPWYEPGGPMLWWSPDPRAVLIPGRIHVPRRLARTLRQGRFEVTVDRDFDTVIDRCAEPRSNAADTWITPEMKSAYRDLHRAGYAHSLEIRNKDELVGGVYGVAQGSIFFAESKFHTCRDASKVALVSLIQYLHERSFTLCDCQFWNPHLSQFGIEMLPRERFLDIVQAGVVDSKARAFGQGPSI